LSRRIFERTFGKQPRLSEGKPISPFVAFVDESVPSADDNGPGSPPSVGRRPRRVTATTSEPVGYVVVIE
jgi:hypothetical protein